MEQVLYKQLSRRRFGIEIEINNTISRNLIKKVIENYSHHKLITSNYRQSINNDYWHIKNDASCGRLGDQRDRGWEIASFVGSGYEDLLHIGKIADELKKIGATTNRNCGLHVHVEVDDFDETDMGTFLVYWMKVEWLLLNAVSPLRDLEYCAEMTRYLPHLFGCHYKRIIVDPKRLWENFRPMKANGDVCTSLWNNWYRWRAINLVNYNRALSKPKFKRKTIEFRIPEGTVESEDIINWTRLFINFVDNTKDGPAPRTLEPSPFYLSLHYLGLHHDGNNFYIFSEGLHKTRLWLMNRIIWHQRLKNNNAFGAQSVYFSAHLISRATTFLDQICA